MRTALAVTSIALCLACSKKEASRSDAPDPKQVLAKIDDTVITIADLERHIAKQPPFVRSRYAAPERKKELLENLVKFEVMAREATKRGYDRDPEVVRFVKQQMINQLMMRELDSKWKPEDVPEADAEKYYRDHPAEFAQQEEVRVSQILIKDTAKATKVAAAAKALAKTDEKGFRDLVLKHSEDEDSKSRGGDLTFFDRKSAVHPRPVVEAAFALKDVNDVSAPVQSDRGLHILKLTQRRPGFTRPFAEVKRQIQTRLYHEGRTAKVDGWVKQMRQGLKVEVFEDKLSEVKVDTTAQALPPQAQPPKGQP
jgi:peptidyl-prolyl cis-trans isomerase C